VRPVLADQTVGVMGCGEERHASLADSVGELLARFEVNVLTGGGGGVMEAVSRAFIESRRGGGICIGIIPCSEEDPSTPKPGYPNRFVELPIYTHLPYSGVRGGLDLSRNHINVLSCDAIVALPGGPGTASEVSLAVRYRKPIVVFSPDEALVEQFPKDAPRVARLDDVAGFLAQHLRGLSGREGSYGWTRDGVTIGTPDCVSGQSKERT
jgi:uncharacterized protein (TIGR00725 family)